MFPRTFIINSCFLISADSIVFIIFYKHMYICEDVLLHLFYKRVYFLHIDMEKQLFLQFL